MSPLDAAIVRRKLQVIIENLRHLRDIQALDLERYKKSRFEKKAAERWLQELVEAAIDINVHLLSGMGYAVPEENYHTFIELGVRGLVSQDLAPKLAPAAGLRNRLVHEYNDIDDEKVWKAIADAEQLFPLYVKAIEEFLERTLE